MSKISLPYILGLVILFIMGFLLRTINIGELSLFVDEFVHYNRAHSFLESTSPLFTNDNNGILYTIFILPFFKLFSESIFWARFPSALFGAGSIILVYKIGERLINRYVGLIGATLNALSLYLIFWSRMARNYAIYEFFFLLFILALWRLLEPNQVREKSSLLKRFNINRADVLITVVTFILAILSHRLIYLCLFSIPAYLGVMAIVTSGNRTEKNRLKYTYMGIVSTFFVLLLSVLFVTNSLEWIVKLFLPTQLVEWVLPSWERLKLFWKSEPFQNFYLYNSVFQYDLKSPILIFALSGVIIGLVKKPKSSFYLFAFLGIPFFLMSFVFIEPALPKFLIILVPILHIFFGIFSYEVIKFLREKNQWAKGKWISKVLLFSPFLLITTQIRMKEIFSLIKVEQKSGFIVSRKLTNWAFVNYKEPCEYIKPLLKDGDVILATTPESFKFYLKQDIVQFRQHFYNRSAHRYESFPMDLTNSASGHTIENLIITYQNYDRGWLLADYYFDNVMTSFSAKQWVFSHMNFHKDASSDGSVRVFSWDKSESIPSYQAIVEELGRVAGPEGSALYPLEVPDFIGEKLSITVIAERIDSNDEAYLFLNKKYFIPIPKNSNSEVQELSLEIPRDYLKKEGNTIEFVYNNETLNDTKRGFIVYNLTIP